MECFHVQPDDIHGSMLTLRGDESRHLVRVLRKKIGERVWVTNGMDQMFEAEVAEIASAQTTCRIIEVLDRFNEPAIEVTLGVSLLRNPSRFDYLVEKATELGARRIVPLLCERTIPRHAKTDRFRNLALAAMKQCCRSFLPVIESPLPLGDFFQRGGDATLCVLPHEQAQPGSTIPRLLSGSSAVTQALIAVGPEGGFSDPELSAGKQYHWSIVSLGNRRLRSETAALASLTLILQSTPA